MDYEIIQLGPTLSFEIKKHENTISGWNYLLCLLNILQFLVISKLV